MDKNVDKFYQDSLLIGVLICLTCYIPILNTIHLHIIKCIQSIYLKNVHKVLRKVGKKLFALYR